MPPVFRAEEGGEWRGAARDDVVGMEELHGVDVAGFERRRRVPVALETLEWGFRQAGEEVQHLGAAGGLVDGCEGFVPAQVIAGVLSWHGVEDLDVGGEFAEAVVGLVGVCRCGISCITGGST